MLTNIEGRLPPWLPKCVILVVLIVAVLWVAAVGILQTVLPPVGYHVVVVHNVVAFDYESEITLAQISYGTSGRIVARNGSFIPGNVSQGGWQCTFYIYIFAK